MTRDNTGNSPKNFLASVIILTCNEEDNIGPCLESVFGQKLNDPFEVIVVDSSSTDRTRQIVKSYPARLLEIPRGDFSHGHTRQWASERASGRYLVYLVADALPSDENWLAGLIRPLERDEEVAGSYSRQVPRPGAHPVEAARIKDRTAGREERITRQLTDKSLWASLKPLEKLAFCDFDDVSACRRASVVEKIPIPDVPWAEDLYWSKAALEAGYKIAFEPASIVIHSHGRGLIHDFRRGWLDQRVAEDLFGHVYFEDLRGLARKYFLLLGRRWKIIARSRTGLAKKAACIFTQPLELLSEAAGNFIASRRMRTEAVLFDFIRNLDRARLEPPDAKARVMPTRFSAGANPRPVLFSNPNSRVIFSVGIPQKGRLGFAAGINPEAWPMRKDPVRFTVEISGKKAWEEDVDCESPESFRWREAELDLAKYAGRTIEIGFITEAKDTDHAWAGWAEPRVSKRELRSRDRLYNRMLESITGLLLGTPLRHP